LTLFGSLYGCALFAQKPSSADRVFENAKTQAAQQHKLIFLVFGASWCAPCHMQDAFMADQETRPILKKYFVLAKLNVEEEEGKHPELNSPGGEKLMAKLGGVDAQGKTGGVPFLVFLNAAGNPIVNSNRPVQGQPGGMNIGYPSKPEEIDWFMSMLNKAAPKMTADELHTIEKWLRKRGN
jgi:thioredoxin-related protein